MIAFRCVVVMRGISRPVVVDEMSSMAFTSGNAPVALIPIFCALSDAIKKNKMPVVNIFFIWIRDWMINVYN